MKKIIFSIFVSVFILGLSPLTVSANHSWGGYHWARTVNPFNLKLGDNLSSNWKPFLQTTSIDWNQSVMLDTQVAIGQGRKNCSSTFGRVEICNKKYGNNGWLGVAQIWINGSHITQAIVKLNDTYFNSSKYNSQAWKNMVMCQEVGHTLGLDHQDEAFDNPNLNTCMDYSDNPITNQHPNMHDYEELESIYLHLDPIALVNQFFSQSNKQKDIDNFENSKEWGKLIKTNEKVAKYERDFGFNQKMVTFVVYY